MTTLKNTLEEIVKGIENFDYCEGAFETELSMNVELIDIAKWSLNGSNFVEVLVSFENQTGNPSRPSGERVITIEDDFVYDITRRKDSVKFK